MVLLIIITYVTQFKTGCNYINQIKIFTFIIQAFFLEIVNRHVVIRLKKVLRTHIIHVQYVRLNGINNLFVVLYLLNNRLQWSKLFGNKGIFISGAQKRNHRHPAYVHPTTGLLSQRETINRIG